MQRWILDNPGLKLLSLALSIFLWTVVLGEQKVEVSVNLPFELPVPSGMMVVNDAPETLEVSLRGPRTLVKSVVPREVSLRRLDAVLEEGENLIPIQREIARAPRGIEVVDVTPHRLRVVLDRLLDRDVEVVPRIEGTPAEGYVVRQVSVVPSRVLLVGPSSDLGRQSRIRTMPVSVQGQAGTVTARVPLESPGRQVRIREDVSVTVTVEIAPRRS